MFPGTIHSLEQSTSCLYIYCLQLLPILVAYENHLPKWSLRKHQQWCWDLFPEAWIQFEEDGAQTLELFLNILNDTDTQPRLVENLSLLQCHPGSWPWCWYLQFTGCSQSSLTSQLPRLCPKCWCLGEQDIPTPSRWLGWKISVLLQLPP